MLYFRDFHWLLVHGESRFHAYLTTEARKRDDVTWFLSLNYRASGAVWRRVDWFRRPALHLELSSFQPPADSWKGLEQISYWDSPANDEGGFPFDKRGFLDFAFYPYRENEENEIAPMIGDHLWRVAARDGRWLTVEMALLPDEDLPEQEEIDKLPPLVTPSGEETSGIDSTARWKERAELYLIENVPFGTVIVRAPRNARDVESYALARAQKLIGDLGEPEYVEVNDHSKWEKSSVKLHDDIYVELHFHGQYQH